MVSVSVIVADLDVSLGSVKSELQHVDLYLLDEDRRVLYRFPTTPGQNAFIIQGEHEFSLPIGTRRMVFRVDVTYRKSFLRIERELKTRFYGDGSMLPADVIEPGSYTYRHTTKKKSVQLMNDLNNKAGFVVFRMYINPQSQPCAMRLDTGRVDHPMLDEIKMWIEIIRAINTRYTTHGFGICLVRETYSSSVYSSSKGELTNLTQSHSVKLCVC
ncbi:hypothetical protein BDY19DRAFT_949207 [Irpex rosettiformis]|uniref:Uncharacterized protein n=1 Tax=Irpex rosettiformis TaxID=378272 RepID=A0ACB8U3A7_9APHY|nr:hypothetical protein BDY19DRAFT_949207 [Irpex rosettiformis]